MANEKHLAKLSEGVDVWNVWVDLQDDNFKANLGGADLRGMDLRGVNFSFANLFGANLTGANLLNANLYKADLRKSSITGVNIRGACLLDADYSGADLHALDLRESYFSRGKLQGADLNGARFRGADFSKANLADANLIGADFSEANLAGANLVGADLRRAIFFGAELLEADLKYAWIRGTDFSDIDLSGARGLEEVKHLGPSTIDYRTIQKTSPPLSDVFLRGCGLPNWQIEAMKLFRTGITPDETIDISYEIVRLRVDQPIQFYSCFISYSHKDKMFARRLHDQLQDQGIRCWMDEHQMLPGDDIYEQVDRGIKLWDKTLLCCSEKSLKSWWVNGEIDTAFEKERLLMEEKGEEIRALVPLDLDGYLFSGNWKNGKERRVKSRLAADFTGWEKDNQKFEEQLERLVKALQTDGAGREKPPPPLLGKGT